MTDPIWGGEEWRPIAEVAGEARMPTPEFARWVRSCGFSQDLDRPWNPTRVRRWAGDATIASIVRTRGW